MPTLTEAQLRRLIAAGETSTFELKIAPPRSSELAERICGLANGRGGRVVIGVEDATLTIVGVPNPPFAVDTVLRAARLVTPVAPLDPPEPELYIIEGKTLVVATIPASTGPIYQAGGVFWIRRGTHTIPLTVAEVLEMAGERGVVAWERLVPPQTTLTDIDPLRLETYMTQRKMRRLPQATILDMLDGLDCVTRGADGSLHPNNAGLLFFGHAPQRAIPHSDVMCVLFRDTLGVGGYIDQRIVTGTLPEIIDGVVAFVDKHLAVSGQILGWKRVDTPEYPIEALREAIVNAVVHRDYIRTGESVRLLFYPDRIEVRSPGVLLPTITVTQMAAGTVPSKLRNPLLANLLHDLPGYMERMGSGIRFMLHTMNALHLPPPEFAETTEVVVTFRATPQPLISTDVSAVDAPRSLLVQAQRLEIGMRYLQQYSTITATTYAGLTGASLTTAIRDLEYLVSAQTLLAVGRTRGRYYRLP